MDQHRYCPSVPLSPEAGRVLGCLVEKQLTTPQQYPLTLNALAMAANQATNRDPVVNLDDEVYGLDAPRYALLATLLLRGPQTVGELRARSERMVDFPSVSDVQEQLN